MLKFTFCLGMVLAFTVAHAGTEPRSLSETPLGELYRQNEEPTLRVRFLSSFFSLLPTLREHHLTLDRWFREDHVIYLLDFLTDSEKTEMISIFERIQQRIENGNTDMKTALVGAGPAVLMAKVAKVDLEVLRLKEQHKDVIRFALSKHESENNQLYGVLPYSYHLRNVRAVLKRFGFGPKDSFFALKLGTAAWLHDVIEDTDATYEDLVELFGQEIADIVQGVTKVSGENGESKAEIVRLTYTRTAQNKGSRILKLADRIANVEEGLMDLFGGRRSKVQKYFDEYETFRELLYVPGDADEMWLHLERLLTDLGYAQDFAISNSLNPKVECEAAL